MTNVHFSHNYPKTHLCVLVFGIIYKSFIAMLVECLFRRFRKYSRVNYNCERKNVVVFDSFIVKIAFYWGKTPKTRKLRYQLYCIHTYNTTINEFCDFAHYRSALYWQLVADVQTFSVENVHWNVMRMFCIFNFLLIFFCAANEWNNFVFGHPYV